MIRAGGDVAGASCVQVVPFHDQVVLTYVPCTIPPKRIREFNAGSYVSIAPYSAGGDVAGDSCVQVVPFHDQVSPSGALEAESPPKSIIWPDAGS